MSPTTKVGNGGAYRRVGWSDGPTSSSAHGSWGHEGSRYTLLNSVQRSDPGDDELIQKAVRLARRLQERADQLQTPQERRQQAEFDRMMQHPADKVTLVQLTDQAFRARTPARSVDQLTHILDVQGIPRFFSPLDRTLLRGFQSFGAYLPGVAAPLVKEKMDKETANVVLPAEAELLSQHLRARRDEGLRMNVNLLGEALLGEREADRRLERYFDALRNDAVEVVSVKVSTLYSQISPMAREHTISILCDRMELLYRAASRARYGRRDEADVAKFVYMDMEEYRDLEITAEVFRRTLDRPGLKNVSAGIALQAYVPDSFAVQRRLTEWARGRVEAGGAPITIRVVKGANMEMERMEASLRDWPQAPFKSKKETDANYKRMVRYGLQPEHARAAHIGVASHNLFDLAYGLVASEALGTRAQAQFEMLEGMANHQRRALFEQTQDLLLYAPACRQTEFVNAIGYLIRRLDENTGPGNFLRHAFRLSVDSEEWRELERDFVAAFDRIEGLPDAPRRDQDRRLEPASQMEKSRPWTAFLNEADTDFSLPRHADWATAIYDTWRERCGGEAPDAPLVVAGREVAEARDIGVSTDPSRPGIVVGRFRIATSEDVEAAVECARRDPAAWRRMTAFERGALLRRVAQYLRRGRADLIGIALAEGGKLLTESDREVSEAVDFCEFYGRTAESFESLASVGVSGLGVVVVVSPWNFPIAIPCGGVAAALAAGNTVILKPAPSTVVTAYRLCQCFWDAGVSREALQFVFGRDGAEATALVAHPDVDAVVFTGGTATAFHLLTTHPGIRLLAETGGKNAMVVTALSDRDLAIKHVVHSAFGHSGQKCSATSLLILEGELYDDQSFRETLVDAIESLAVGSAWEPSTSLGPLIRPPTGKLEAALKELEDGESWALRPRPSTDNPNLWSPAVKWGVRPGSVTHVTEFFGPVLAVMRARDLEDAIALVNGTGYGLTSGLQSLDEREQELWTASVRAGNLYVNRGTTGALVLRQPFGGIARSSIGPGLKAGGPNYVVPLMRFQDERRPRGAEEVRDRLVASLLNGLGGRPDIDAVDLDNLRAAAASYTLQSDEEFGRDHDHFRLVGQDNLRRYLPVGNLRIRVSVQDTFFDVFARVCAARIAGCQITVSIEQDRALGSVKLLETLTESWAGAIEIVEESDAELADVVRRGQTDRLRYASEECVPPEVRQAAIETGVYLATAPVLREGRVELLWYVVEQSLSVDYHRYGNLGARAHENRSPVA